MNEPKKPNLANTNEEAMPSDSGADADNANDDHTETNSRSSIDSLRRLLGDSDDDILLRSIGDDRYNIILDFFRLLEESVEDNDGFRMSSKRSPSGHIDNSNVSSERTPILSPVSPSLVSGCTPLTLPCTSSLSEKDEKPVEAFLPLKTNSDHKNLIDKYMPPLVEDNPSEHQFTEKNNFSEDFAATSTLTAVVDNHEFLSDTQSDFLLDELDEDVVFKELRAINSLLSKTSKADISNAGNVETKQGVREGNAELLNEGLWTKKDELVRKTEEVEAEGPPLHENSKNVNNILTDLEHFLDENVDEKRALTTEENDRHSAEQIMDNESSTSLSPTSEDDNPLSPLNMKIKPVFRRRRIVSKMEKPQKMVTGITFTRPSTSKNTKNLNCGRIPCKYCGECYYLGPGMSSHVRWKHRNAAVQTCPHCEQTFADYKEFVEHLEECRTSLARSIYKSL